MNGVARSSVLFGPGLGLVRGPPGVPPENSVLVATQRLTRFTLLSSIGYDTTSQGPNGEVAMGIVGVVVFSLRPFLLPRAVIVAENLALRQQLAVMRRSSRPSPTTRHLVS
jgi:hypothetical protein